MRHEQERRRLLASFAAFVKEAWDIVEPQTPLVWGWHLDAICLHLQAVAEGRIQQLLINIPPGHAKSIVITVLWVAWRMARDPGWTSLCGSYDMSLSLRDAVRCREVLESEWFRSTFNVKWSLKTDQNLKSHFATTENGYRVSIATRGRAIGWRGAGIVVDDPLNAKAALSEVELEEAERWVTKILPTRVNRQGSWCYVVIMQRLHESDPSGVLLKQGGWEHLCLPAEYEPERHCSTSIGWEDPRTEPGELLFPELFPAEVLDDLKTKLGAREYAGQYQQRPSPAEGNIIQRSWTLRRSKRQPEEVAQHATEMAITCDLTFGKQPKLRGGKSNRSWVVLQVWARLGPDFWLLDEARGRWSFTEMRQVLRDLCGKWPKAHLKLVEEAAAGVPVVDDLRREIPGFVLVPATKSKAARCEVAARAWESGNVVLPDASVAPWILDWIEEIVGFPTAANDDRVDAMSQLLIYWIQHQRVHPLLRK